MFLKREKSEINGDGKQMIDFTLLDPRATKNDIEKLCDIAYKNRYYAVCVNPCFVSLAKGYILENFDGDVKVVSVIGFPLGANKTETKLEEARAALEDGADELDVVINIGKAREQDFKYVSDELRRIKKLAKRKVVKAIIETCYFDDNDIVKLCSVVVKAGLDYVKTSTGFGTGGADERVVKLMCNAVKGKCQVKASGGIRTREQMNKFLNLGVTRIGTSSVI